MLSLTKSMLMWTGVSWPAVSDHEILKSQISPPLAQALPLGLLAPPINAGDNGRIKLAPVVRVKLSPV
jgi:hypothetical protein